jgi:hypothetical protein
MAAAAGMSWGNEYGNDPVHKRDWENLPKGVRDGLVEDGDRSVARKYLTSAGMNKYMAALKEYSKKLQEGSRSPRSIERGLSGSHKRASSLRKKALAMGVIKRAVRKALTKRAASKRVAALAAVNNGPPREGKLRRKGAGWEVYRKGKWGDYKGATVLNAEGKYGGPYGDARDLQAVPAYIADLRKEYGLAAGMSNAEVIKAVKTARRAATVAAKTGGGRRRGSRRGATRKH